MINTLHPVICYNHLPVSIKTKQTKTIFLKLLKCLLIKNKSVKNRTVRILIILTLRMFRNIKENKLLTLKCFHCACFIDNWRALTAISTVIQIIKNRVNWVYLLFYGFVNCNMYRWQKTYVMYKTVCSEWDLNDRTKVCHKSLGIRANQTVQ